MQSLSKNLAVALVAMTLGCLLTGLVMSLPQGLRSDVYAQQREASEQARENLATAQDLSSAFRNIADSLRPSVVSISTTFAAETAQAEQPLPPQLRGLPGWMLEDFFGDTQRFRAPRRTPERRGMGSGVIVRDDGYVLTNNHVVEGSSEVAVELSDGRKLRGEIVGTDPETDLAVLKIDAPDLQPAPLGSSEEIRVGDWVLAIGSPFGLDQTVTAGIISGKNRVRGIVSGDRGFEDFLQTDAAINPGNSGGPLVNLRGEVVGINTAILSRSGGNAGIGFAIPVGLARPVLDSIIKTGEVRRGFLGAQVGDVTPETVEKFGLKADSGAFLSGVIEDQPAANAGLQPGDVITEIDGRPVRSGNQVKNYVASRPPGESVTMKVNRDGETMTVEVNLGERTDEALSLFGRGDLFGAKMVPVTPESAAKYGYSDLEDGLIVIAVEDESLAAQGGLQVGDVIEKAAGVQVESVRQLSQIFEEAKRRELNLQVVVRRGNGRFMLVFQP